MQVGADFLRKVSSELRWAISSLSRHELPLRNPIPIYSFFSSFSSLPSAALTPAAATSTVVSTTVAPIFTVVATTVTATSATANTAQPDTSVGSKAISRRSGMMCSKALARNAIERADESESASGSCRRNVFVLLDWSRSPSMSVINPEDRRMSQPETRTPKPETRNRRAQFVDGQLPNLQ